MTSSTDMPMTGANEFDEDGINDHDGFNGVNWRKVTVVVLALAALIIAGLFAWHKHEQSQLPALFVAGRGDSVVTHVTATRDPVKQVRIAVRAAELIRQPVYATEICGQAVQLVSGQCGVPHEVSHKRAHQLASHTDTVLLDVRLQPGDLVDAKRGVFISHDDPMAVGNYLQKHTLFGSPEQARGLDAIIDGLPRSTDVTVLPPITVTAPASVRGNVT